MNLNALTSFGDKALHAVGLKNRAFLIAAPAVAVGVLSIGSRVGAGLAALGCKGASKVAEYADKKDLSESLNNAKDACMAFATRSVKKELAAAAVLTGVAAAGFGVAKLMGASSMPPMPKRHYRIR
jgi:hypothetical protein